MMNVKEYVDEAEKSGKYKSMIMVAFDNGLEIGGFGDMYLTPIMLGEIFYSLEQQTGVNVNDIGDLMVLGYKMRVCANENNADKMDELMDRYSDKYTELFGDGGKYE